MNTNPYMRGIGWAGSTGVNCHHVSFHVLSSVTALRTCRRPELQQLLTPRRGGRAATAEAVDGAWTAPVRALAAHPWSGTGSRWFSRTGNADAVRLQP